MVIWFWTPACIIFNNRRVKWLKWFKKVRFFEKKYLWFDQMRRLYKNVDQSNANVPNLHLGIFQMTVCTQLFGLNLLHIWSNNLYMYVACDMLPNERRCGLGLSGYWRMLIPLLWYFWYCFLHNIVGPCMADRWLMALSGEYIAMFKGMGQQGRDVIRSLSLTFLFFILFVGAFKKKKNWIKHHQHN